jgi:hypothetical protein
MPKKTSIALLTIDATGVLEFVQPVRATPDSTVLIVMSNEHAADDFRVVVRDFRRKETMTAALPLVGAASHSRLLHPGEVDFVKVKTLPAANFGNGGLPYTTYKYTVDVTNLSAGTPTVPVDPELDVCPP